MRNHILIAILLFSSIGIACGPSYYYWADFKESKQPNTSLDIKLIRRAMIEELNINNKATMNSSSYSVSESINKINNIFISNKRPFRFRTNNNHLALKYTKGGCIKPYYALYDVINDSFSRKIISRINNLKTPYDRKVAEHLPNMLRFTYFSCPFDEDITLTLNEKKVILENFQKKNFPYSDVLTASENKDISILTTGLSNFFYLPSKKHFDYISTDEFKTIFKKISPIWTNVERHIYTKFKNFIFPDQMTILSILANNRTSLGLAKKCGLHDSNPSFINLIINSELDKRISNNSFKEILNFRSIALNNCINYRNNKLNYEFSSLPKDWKFYFLGLQAFYNKDYSLAESYWKMSRESANQFIIDNSTYMAGRAKLIQSQSKWYGSYSEKGLLNINMPSLSKSKEYFIDHISNNGVYSDSAKGLLRKISLLEGKNDEYLSTTYKKIINLISKKSYSYIANKKVNNLIFEASRFDTIENISKTIINLPKSDFEIESIKKFIIATNHYYNKEYMKAWELMKGLKSSYAYDYKEDLAKKLSLTEDLKAIYADNLDEKNKELYLNSPSFHNGSAKFLLNSSNNEVVKITSQSYCDANKLLDIAKTSSTKNRKIIQQEVLKRMLLNEDFNTLMKLMKDASIDKGDFEQVRTAISQISNNKKLGKAYMNIAYFVKTKLSQPATSMPQLFKDNPKLFCENINAINSGAKYFFSKSLTYFGEEKSIDEAKSLHYLITCQRSSSGCWGYPIENTSTSKELFEKLHSKYANTKWANKTPYYY